MNAGPVRYYGKYRGVVTETTDPSNLGRIKAKLDDFPGWKDNWCMPCVPYAGKNVGWFVIPEIGARVWIEFEGGDPDRAIWVGCFWDAGTIPPTASPTRKVWQTPTNRIVLDDLDGKAGQLEIDSTTRDGQTVLIRFDTTGITLTAKSAQITLAIDDGITIAYPESTVKLTNSQIALSEGSASSITVTSHEQTLSSGSLTFTASNSLSVTASASTSISTGQYSLSGSTVSIAGGAISIG